MAAHYFVLLSKCSREFEDLRPRRGRFYGFEFLAMVPRTVFLTFERIHFSDEADGLAQCTVHLRLVDASKFAGGGSVPMDRGVDWFEGREASEWAVGRVRLGWEWKCTEKVRGKQRWWCWRG